MVAQKTVLFRTTVKENVGYGMWPPPSDEEVKEALKKAMAWDFIEEKPDQLLTMLTATGGGFSGGQMQRLAIARALIRKPNIILLDEATAALDPVNERAVQDTLDRVMKGYTTIAIAHRLTTIKDADKIIVIEKGAKVEEGPHEDLLKIPITTKIDPGSGKQIVQSGFYHNQWNAQFREKGLNTAKLKVKIEQLQTEIDVHTATIERTDKNSSKWRNLTSHWGIARTMAEGKDGAHHKMNMQKMWDIKHDDEEEGAGEGELSRESSAADLRRSESALSQSSSSVLVK